MDAPALPDETIEGELVDPEDVAKYETVWVARHLDLVFDGRLTSQQTMILASGIDTSEFVSCVAVFILHSKNAWATGVGLKVTVQAVELDPLEPEIAFLGPSLDVGTLDTAASIAITNVTSLPPRIRVNLVFSHGASEATASQSGCISVKLVLRRHAPVRYRVLPTARVIRSSHSAP